MTMRLPIALIALLLIPGLTAAGEEKANAEGRRAGNVKYDVLSVRKAIDALKLEAKPVADGQVVKDHGGCLYAFSHQDGRLVLIQIQDEQKLPVCGA